MESTSIAMNETFLKTVEELRDSEKKNLRINRIKLGIAAFTAVFCVVIGIVLFVHVGRITENINSISEVMTEAGENINLVAADLQKINFAEIGESAKAFADVGAETTRQIQQATSGLDTILNDAETAIKNISSIKIEDRKSTRLNSSH